MNAELSIERAEPGLSQNFPPPAKTAAIGLPVRHGWLDFTNHRICYHNGATCEFSERESELLSYLVKNAGRVVSRDELLTHVWRLDPRHILTRVIDMHVAHIREKLRDNTKRGQILRTIHGVGYMFVAGAR